MDFLVNQKNKATQNASDAQNEVNAAQAKRTTWNKAAQDADAIIADCVVVP